MARLKWILSLTAIALASPVTAVAAQDEPVVEPAPPGTADTLYCLRVDPITGSRISSVLCRTRYEWAMLEVDVDQEWAENGVRVENG